MNVLYVLGGMALVIFGLWQIRKEVKIFRNRNQDPLGNDIKLIGSGFMALMIGIYLIAKYI